MRALLPRVAMSCLALCAVLCAAGAPAAAPARSYPLTLTRGSRLLVAARINGQPVEALLDSAAEATFIDPRLAERLHLSGGATTTAQGSGAKTFEARLIAGVRLEAFGVSVPDQTVATADLGDVGQRLLGRRLDVILGREIFDAARLKIDIRARRITVLGPEVTPPGVRLPLVSAHGVETLPVRVEGQGPFAATFDLGNGSQVLIGSRLAQKLGVLADGRPVSTRSGGGLGGATPRQVLVLRTLEVAGRAFDDVPAAVDAQASATDVNIGVSILRHFIVTTDFAGHAVWLAPRTAP